MTTFDRIEPRLPELIDELASARVPDYFDDLLQATAQAPQRPAWSALERWLPMGEIARPLPLRTVPWRVIAIAATLVILLTAGLLAFAGSHPPVPAPFGPARGGVFVYHGPDGALYAADPVTGEATAIVTADEAVAYPLPSRDGQRIFYDHTDKGTSEFFIAGIDGSNPHPLPGTYNGFTWVEWSPDGTQLGIVSAVEGMQTISVIDADGTGVRTLPLDREVMTFWWLPDGGFVFTGGERPGDACHPDFLGNRCALLTVGADGHSPEVIIAADAFMGLSTSLSPDGRTVLIDRWGPDEPGRLYLADLRTHTQRPVDMTNLDPVENSNIAEFSPDGRQILFDRYEAAGDHWAVVPTAGGPAVNLGIEWPVHRDGVGPEAHWSADGTKVIAFYPGLDASEDQLSLLDATGKGQDRQLDLPVAYVPPQQRLAP